MANDNRVHMPGVFGGLMRYDSEYRSKFSFAPSHVVGFIVVVVLFVLGLKIFGPSVF